jgi:AraC family transcriptional regulator of adaptative response/methylated-DNA-[protein]-cysteine methyltransferase
MDARNSSLRSPGSPAALAQVQAACDLIRANPEGRHTLRKLAHSVGASPFHLQRSFTRFVGISPRLFVEACRMGRLKAALKKGANVTTALYDAGYSSSSRLYERSDAALGMTPATYKRGGEGSTIDFTVASSPLGLLLVAATRRGVCRVMLGDDASRLGDELRAEYPRAEVRRNDRLLSGHVRQIVAHIRGGSPHVDLPTDVRATAFQWRVWQALRAIPYGETRSYHDIAEAIGAPTATRAVARACATNPVALLIPCHRVVRSDGGLGGYRWGIERKAALLARENATNQGRRRSNIK